VMTVRRLILIRTRFGCSTQIALLHVSAEC
jgi:hypothetical protein